MSDTMKWTLEKGEGWFGATSFSGNHQPFGRSPYGIDLKDNNQGNQAVPLLLSTTGRYLWSDGAFAFDFKDGSLEITGNRAPVAEGRGGSTLREAFLAASKKYFPPTGTIPAPLLFDKPQYNTWIELMYDQNEGDILKYAETLLKEGYPPGVLMIDDTWQEGYGIWEFSPRRFKDPKGMVDKLHRMGFQVMLWVCPFVSSDSVEYRELAKRGVLLMEGSGENDVLWANTKNLPAIVRWWNGASGVLDLSNPGAVAWFKERLDYLQKTFGVDGFKFDAGDSNFYKGHVASHGKVDANTQTELFVKMALDYPLNELRASWKMGGQPIVQRLRDKGHRWSDVALLVPHMIALGLMGHPYGCPDLIGGGEYTTFLNGAVIDEEMVVRSAQCSALMPMMQFSAAPWRVLSAENNRLCLEMARLHEKFGPLFVELAKQSSKTGEPIVQSLEYQFPGQGYADVMDQFLIGDRLLVAPVVEKGVVRKEVTFPKGTWKGMGKTFTGPTKAVVEAPLSVLPWFEQQG